MLILNFHPARAQQPINPSYTTNLRFLYHILVTLNNWLLQHISVPVKIILRTNYQIQNAIVRNIVEKKKKKKATTGWNQCYFFFYLWRYLHAVTFPRIFTLIQCKNILQLLKYLHIYIYLEIHSHLQKKKIKLLEAPETGNFIDNTKIQYVSFIPRYIHLCFSKKIYFL